MKRPVLLALIAAIIVVPVAAVVLIHARNNPVCFGFVQHYGYTLRHLFEELGTQILVKIIR